MSVLNKINLKRVERTAIGYNVLVTSAQGVSHMAFSEPGTLAEAEDYVSQYHDGAVLRGMALNVVRVKIEVLGSSSEEVQEALEALAP